MNKTIITISIAFIVLTLGCSTTKTHLGPLPTAPLEFEQSIYKIQEKYPEVKKYTGANHCGILRTECEHVGIFNMPPIAELTNLWGSPDEITGSLWNLQIFPILTLQPIKTYIWHKGNYRIEVMADHPAIFHWEPHIWYWQWYLQDRDTLHENSKIEKDKKEDNKPEDKNE
jgi:hypothetical protein